MEITREKFHRFIDSIENEQLLAKYLAFLQKFQNSKDGQLWNSLSKTEKEELLISYEESKEDKNLVAHEVLLGMLKN